jgi:glycosyltransferase involved in cell wall biosynthesis
MEKNKNRLIFFMPSMEGGGVEKNLILIANYISKFKQNVFLITFDNGFNKYFNKNISILNVRKKDKKKFSKYYKYFFCLIILLKEYIKNKHFVLFSFQANIYSIIFSYFLNFKIISRSNSSPSGWNKSYIKNLIFSFFIKRANIIIVNSNDFKKEFLKKFQITPKLIYNPLNYKEIIKKSKQKVKIEKKFKSKKNLKLINIARLTDQKNQEILIKAMNIVAKKIDCTLLIMGYGSNKRKLKNLINHYNLNGCIKLIDYKSNPFPYLKASDVFVLTSKYEGLPNVILESQTLNKYVISTDCPTGPKEILMNGMIGSLFKVGDFKKLASILLDYNKNKKKYEKKIKIANSKLDRFDYKQNCHKYLSLINSII